MASAPTISDGIVLTEFSLNSSFVDIFQVGADYVQAYLNQPFRFGNLSDATVKAVSAKLQEPLSLLENTSVQQVLEQYDLIDYLSGLKPKERVQYAPGYLTESNAGATQYQFFLPGFYDPEIVPYAEENKQPIAAGELLTSGSALSLNAFRGPVMVITGCTSSAI